MKRAVAPEDEVGIRDFFPVDFSPKDRSAGHCCHFVLVDGDGPALQANGFFKEGNRLNLRNSVYWKQHQMANFCPKEMWELSYAASQALERIPHRERRPKLIAALLVQATSLRKYQ